MRKRQASKWRFGFCKGIYLSYFFLVCLLVMTFFGYNYAITKKTVIENTYQSLLANQRQISIIISQELEELFTAGNVVYMSHAFNSLYPMANADKRDNANDIVMYYEARKAFLSIAQVNGERALRVYVHDNVLFANEREIFCPISDISVSEWFQKLQKLKKSWMWCYDTSGSEPMIAYVRLVYHNDLPFVVYSGLAVNALMKTVQSPFSDRGGITLMYSDEHSVLPDPRAFSLADEDRLNIVAATEKGALYVEIGGKTYMFSQTAISYDRWHILSLLPAESVLVGFNDSLIPSAIFMIACFAASILVAALLGNLFVRRIRRLIYAMENINPEDPCGLVEVRGTSEISLIEEKFNAMILRLRSLIEEINTSNTLKRKAEMRALQAQINPHFLYNTLDTINWMAIEADEMRISKMVSSLGHFYRLSLSDGRDVISVKDEIQIARAYACLQHMRYEKMLEIDFDVDESCLQFRCVKLIIQPLIENAVKHGGRAESGFILRIMVKLKALEGKRIGLWVTNNGKELPTKNSGSNCEIGRSGYGLENVLQRLTLNFGDDVLLRICNKENAPGVEVYMEWSASVYSYEKKETERNKRYETGQNNH